MSDQDFIHLHVHTEYSLLDGLSKISKLVDRAKALEMDALAISDHGTMFGVLDFYRACKKAEIKPIIGVEGYLARRGMHDRDSKLDTKPFHLLMLAENATGYKNLLRIASASQLEGYYYKPRIDWNFLEQHKDGLIVTSGCLAAQIPGMIMDGREMEARALIDRYLQVFGRDHFFLELQQHDIPELKPVNEWLIEIGRKDDVRFVATNDVHYVLEDDFDAHDTLLCIQSSATKNDPKRLKMSDNSYFLSSKAQMWDAFGHINDGEALHNTRLIAEMCDLNLDDKQYHLPVFPIPDEFADPNDYMAYLAYKGLRWRYGERADSDPALRERLDFELSVISKMGFATYFLIVWDLCEYARAVDIWWNVRGSGAGSVVAYTLGITNIDPIENNLLFERFLNPGRVTMPDIDMDFPDDRREEMTDYTARKYGTDKVALIITFGTLGAKAAVRDVGRALDVDPALVSKVAGLIPTEPKPKPVRQYIEDNPELKGIYNAEPQIQMVVDTAASLQGVSRHASTHAAGVIVSDKPLVEYLPLHRLTKIAHEARDENGDKREKRSDDERAKVSIQQVTQFPMETCESIGLLKIDFLGLSTLTILRRASDLIEKHHGVRLTMDNIPYKPSGDPEADRQLARAFELLSRGDTVGVFQVESSGMQQMLREMRPSKFEHIIAGVALYRPGPMDYIPEFNARLHGEKVVNYHHPGLEPILGETFGICVAGDTLLVDAESGQQVRIDTLTDRKTPLYVQGVDADYKPAVGRVTHWFANGVKPVYRLQLRNGATIEATADHQFLTETGWKRLGDLQAADYVATPSMLLEPGEAATYNHDKLRVLAYLIADGSLGSFASVDFVNKAPELIEEYIRCLDVFGDVSALTLSQIRDVTRVMTRGKHGKATTSLLKWLRELGLKHPAGTTPGGKRSQEKFVPPFIFSLANEDIAFFLASLWDCDGYINNRLCHYKTISKQLAHDIQTLLLRFGISSTIYRSQYESVRGTRQAYQVTVYATEHLARLLQPHMLSEKRLVNCIRHTSTNINRELFIGEVDRYAVMPRRSLTKLYNIPRLHFTPQRRQRSERIAAKVVQHVAAAIPLPETQRLLRLDWEEIVSIEPAGEKPVYDITVEGLHNYVANNILVHNCVYQEQIMQIASSLFGYSLGDADLMRRAVSKKKKEDLLKHRAIFLENGPKHGVSEDAAAKIFDDIEFFANYGFNRCLTEDTLVVDAATGRQVTIGALARHETQIEETVTCNVDTLQLQSGRVTDVIANGVKPVYKLKTRAGREITATGNHPFYTYDGWQVLETLRPGNLIATPRRLPIEGQNTWQDYKLITLGHLLAEGNLCHTTGVYYYTTDDEHLADYVSHMEQFENSVASVSWHRSAYSVYSKRRQRSQPQGLCEWLRALDLWGKDARTKAIPDEVFTLTNANIALLLARMWEGDGHVNPRTASIFYATASKQLVQQIQHLLLRFGIVGRVYTKLFPYKEGRIGYQLHVTGEEMLRGFKTHIGPYFFSQKKRAALDNLLTTISARTGVRDVIPVGVRHLVRAEREVQGIEWSQIEQLAGVSTSEFHRRSSWAHRNGFQRATIAGLATALKSAPLRRLADSDIYWDEIVSIESAGEAMTYDLTIEGTHNFIANDILVHNSHAADYAVITVQSAYLKAQYAAEYMAALLSVYFDDAAKVVTFLAECKRLNIPILPPSINHSVLDFDIEMVEDGTRAIRFGMAAIKNAGVGALGYIIREREQNGPFHDLEDLCERVDLRQVGRKAVEVLIKVGAFGGMGTRPQLLKALDRLIAHSTNAFRSKETGQMGLFGEAAASHELLGNLPNADDISYREILGWEKELLGLYVSSHPIDPALEQLRGINVNTTLDLTANAHDWAEKPVRLVGLISSLRKVLTKNKDFMGIIQLEDKVGHIDAVLFPRTWKKFEEQIEEDKVIVVMGKLDLSRGDPQIIVEAVTRELQGLVADNDNLYPQYEPPAWMNETPQYATPPSGTNGVHETNGSTTVVHNGNEVPPPSFDELPPVDGEWLYAPEAETSPRLLTLRFHRNGDDEKDVRRFNHLMKTLDTFPGRDYFEILLMREGELEQRLQFEKTIHLCDQLLKAIASIKGVEVVIEMETPLNPPT